VHGFAAPLGAHIPAPHGTVCAALLPRVMEANVQALRAKGEKTMLKRYAEIGRILVGRQDLEDDAAIDAGVACTHELACDLRIPGLSHYGLREGDVATLVARAKKASSMRYNPVELDDAALTAVLRAAI
jgi:alcohol dehydrogenase